MSGISKKPNYQKILGGVEPQRDYSKQEIEEFLKLENLARNNPTPAQPDLRKSFASPTRAKKLIEHNSVMRVDRKLNSVTKRFAEKEYLQSVEARISRMQVNISRRINNGSLSKNNVQSMRKSNNLNSNKLFTKTNTLKSYKSNRLRPDGSINSLIISNSGRIKSSALIKNDQSPLNQKDNSADHTTPTKTIKARSNSEISPVRESRELIKAHYSKEIENIQLEFLFIEEIVQKAKNEMILLINKEMKLHIRDPNASLTKSPRMVCFSLDCSEKKLAPLKDLLSSLLIRTSEDSKSIRPPNENKRDQYLGGDNTLFSKKKKPKHSNSGRQTGSRVKETTDKPVKKQIATNLLSRTKELRRDNSPPLFGEQTNNIKPKEKRSDLILALESGITGRSSYYPLFE